MEEVERRRGAQRRRARRGRVRQGDLRPRGRVRRHARDHRRKGGTGPEGRIVKEDVLAAAGGGPRSERRRPESPAAPSGPEVEVIEPTRMQATIAKRMAEAKATVPNFNVTVEARVDEAVKLRQQLKESVPGAEKVTMTDMLMRACALALRRFPEVNSSWVDGRFQRKRSINIGLAVPQARAWGCWCPWCMTSTARTWSRSRSSRARSSSARARAGPASTTSPAPPSRS